MEKPDLIITWIANCDYPLYRKWLEKYHSFFNEIIVYFDLSFRFPIFSAFIQSSLSHLPNIRFLDPIEFDRGKDDWRNVSTRKMLQYSKASWIASIEQDFFAKDWEKLFDITQQALQKSDLFGWLNPTEFFYYHPAFWFAKREVLDKTSKDFSPHPEINGCDHFAMITKEAFDLGAKTTSLADMGIETNVIDPIHTDAFHLGGVNQNFLNGLTDGYAFHRGELFRLYNQHCLKVKPLHPVYEEISKKLEVKLSGMYPEVDLGWSVFFK